MDPGSTQCIVERGDHGPWTLVAPMRACYRAPLGPSVGVFGGVERRRAGDGGRWEEDVEDSRIGEWMGTLRVRCALAHRPCQDRGQ